MSLKLRLEGTHAEPVPYHGALITLGRAQGNDLVIADPRISSRHGRLVRRGEGYVYEDLGSRNGSEIRRADGARTIAEPNLPCTISAGDQLCLGDRDAPVIVTVIDAPESAPARPADGGTVVARRALLSPESTLVDAVDVGALKALFSLIHQVSGLDDPHAVITRISQATLERFPQANAVTVELADGENSFTVAFTESRDDRPAMPCSATLRQRTLESREAITYLPGVDPTSGSMLGLAGAALVPLVTGDAIVGVLHVQSRRRPFSEADLSWLSVVGTHLSASITAAQRARALKDENQALKADSARPIIGESPALQQALHQLTRVGRTDTTVLVTGETGTGKELAARHVHHHSKRASKPFCAINCGALPENLLESELFGHVKGAFTGADRDRKGLFESASGGTVFLDEIGEISTAVQVRLLRVLQEKEVQPVGSRSPRAIDVRIVAATNRDLQAEVGAGRFREDLYYRLAIFPVKLPPLRDRAGDVERLAERFRELACARHDTWLAGFSPEAMAALTAYTWPGNVRQLEHEIERAVILAGGGRFIGLGDLSPQISGQQPMAAPASEAGSGTLHGLMDAYEERLIRARLDQHGGNRTRTAQDLGISRQALQAKLARWRKRDTAE
ncbi:MAG: sigma 54-interacting transcriptional regulator [Bradymonadia bacterium]